LVPEPDPDPDVGVFVAAPDLLAVFVPDALLDSESLSVVPDIPDSGIVPDPSFTTQLAAARASPPITRPVAVIRRNAMLNLV
jgi:hypothetical protein